jgi:hypothetical protein
MKKFFLFVLLTVAEGISMYSQQLSIAFSGGVGTFSMSELKSLNESLQPDFDAELVTSFPPYFFYKPSLLLRLHRYTAGLTYTYQSTGSRISAKDYSGEYRFDTKVHSNNMGLYVSADVVKWTNLRISVYAEPGLSFSSLEINQYLCLFDTVLDDQTTRFKALNFYLEPGIDFSYLVSPSVTATANLGYYLQWGKQDFYTGGDKDNELVNPITDESVKPGWKGLRFGITLAYNISFKAHQPNAVQEAQ